MIWLFLIPIILFLVLLVLQANRISRLYDAYYTIKNDVKQRLELHRMTSTFTVSSDMVIKELEEILEEIEGLEDEL